MGRSQWQARQYARRSCPAEMAREGMSTAIILIIAALVLFAWRTGRLSAVWAATTGAEVLPGKAKA